jgi:hypothetical protein
MAYGFNEDKEKIPVYSQNDIGQLVQQIMLSVYPVGAIYMSVSATDPAELFGGTWTRWGAGRVPVSVNASDTNFNAVEKTGGAATVALTAGQLPAHNHSYTYYTGDGIMTINPDTPGSELTIKNLKQATGTTGNRGSGEAHNNLQPYITCYMWKRTA